MTPPAPESRPPGGPAPTAEPPAPQLASVVLALAEGSQLDTTLDHIVRAAVHHVDATYGAMGMLTPDGRALDRFVVVGMGPADHERIGRLPTGEGILGLLVRHPEPVRLDDLRAHPASAGFPEGHPQMRSFLGVPVRVRDAVFGHLYLTEKRSGGPFTEADEEIAQALAAVAGLAIDNARLVELTDQRRAWAQAGTDIATALLSGADPDEVLRSTAPRVAELAGADAAGLLVPVPGADDVLTVVDAVGPQAPDVGGVRIPVRDTRLGAAHRSGVAVVLEDVADTPPGTPTEGPLIELVGELSGDYGSALLVPLGGPPALGTVVALRNRGRAQFDDGTLEQATAFATQATVALELARSHQRERRLQVEADRDRIARDLHDHVVQRIFATGLALDRVARSLQESAPEIAGRIADRVDELDTTITHIRTAIFELREAGDTGPTTLRRRLGEVIRSLTQDHSLQPDLRVRTGDEDPPADLVHDLVAVVRELVTNVVRHAAASRVTVTVTVSDEVRVVVADDGRGLPAVTVRSGLANLSDRAERRHGRLDCRSGPSGTEIEWVVPSPR